MKKILKLALILLFVFVLQIVISAQNKTKNIILITLDGARTQEIFGGLDAGIFKSSKADAEKTKTYQDFWAMTPMERREKLMPFFWKTLMKDDGSIAGNRALGSTAQTTNQMFFSYPGYSEMLTGQAHDDVINSNDFGQNPYPSVLDFLQKKMNLNSNQVADFASWAAMSRIATSKPNSFLINAGYTPYQSTDKDVAELNRAQFQAMTPSPNERHDYITFKFAMSHLKTYHPRVMHLSFIETDMWGHSKNYDRMVSSFNVIDGFLKDLWDFLQSDTQYRDKTTIVITNDHGRGITGEDWSAHSAKIPESQYLWMAFISPDVNLRGEWKNTDTVYQNQIAATIAKFLNYDYSEQNPNAGKPIARLFAVK